MQGIQINIGGTAISNSKFEKSLGIHIDNKLTFEPHVTSLFKNASQNAFITSQFAYLFGCSTIEF